MPDLPKVILKPKRAEPFYGRHPWVFAGAVDQVQGEPRDGAEVELLSSAGNFIARGFYNSQSKIVVRLYSWAEGVDLDEAFFRQRLQQAIRLRRDLLKLDTGPASAYRVAFSEADGLSGLVIDKFANYLTVQFTSVGLAQRRNMLAELLRELLQPKGIYIRTEKGIGNLEGLQLHDGILWGEAPPEEVVIEENQLKFAVNLSEGQKTGYYLDQRDNRLTVAKFAEGKTVLDAFSYSGGFGIYAAQAGAKDVLCLDASAGALKLAERNAELNGFTQLRFQQCDVFGHLTELVQTKQRFDIVVLDPPKFARNRAAIPQAIQGYRKLHQQALKLLNTDGLLVSCCCTGLITLDMLEELIAQVGIDSKRDLQILERRGPSADHPVSVTCREGSYLKCLISRVV
jgi:23S rRNA (cytosine1962-C5)-methyltransferase